ncbi:MAG: hypothetical protein V1777_04170 [Candidatus Micrarchaeota archaeon]
MDEQNNMEKPALVLIGLIILVLAAGMPVGGQKIEENSPIPERLCCGNGVCDSGLSTPGGAGTELNPNQPGDCDRESACTCPQDCPASCGDYCCTGSETDCSCAQDCNPSCGDGCCTGSENYSSCPADCLSTCGNRVCNPGETLLSCPNDCSVCGDNKCTGNETIGNCPTDCRPIGPATETTYCGDHKCNPNEDAAFCPTDCTSTCGDHACTHNENQTTCSQDCVLGCGNNICENNLNENQLNCPVDCGSAEEQVTGQTNLLTIDYSKATNQPTPSQILEQLKQAGYESSIETITASLQNFCITRTVVIEQYYPSQSFTTKTRTAIYLHIQNCNPTSENVWKNLTLIEQINKQIAGSANEITALTPINIINPDPIIEFRIPFLEKTGTTIIYYLPKQLTTEQASLFSFPIINQFTQTTASEIQTLGCKNNNECTDNTCIIGRCISKNCYQIPALNGTACGFGKECIDKTCTQKQLQIINQPTNLIDTPAAILTIITLLLGAWVIREYIKP